jgi:carbonic anhydrase
VSVGILTAVSETAASARGQIDHPMANRLTAQDAVAETHRRSPILEDLSKKETIAIAGSMYDFTTGKVRFCRHKMLVASLLGCDCPPALGSRFIWITPV